MRSGAFSPNHIGHDAAIFNSVAEQLRKRGCVVNIYSEEEFCSGAVNERFILAMCREKRSVERLQELEDAGALVINSGYGIENCTRERMMRIFTGSEIAFPESIAASTNEGVRAALNRLKISRCWIKRGDAPTMHKEDVTFVRHAEEAQEVLQEFFLRGIQRAVISRHVEGRLVKFYGVAGTDFFCAFFLRKIRLPNMALKGRRCVMCRRRRSTYRQYARSAQERRHTRYKNLRRRLHHYSGGHSCHSKFQRLAQFRSVPHRSGSRHSAAGDVVNPKKLKGI